MTIELKIKNKHLAEEAKIIRFEEKKLLKHARSQMNHLRATGTNDWRQELEFYRPYKSLNQHRKWDVRNEQRATYLARAFIEGKKYSEVENAKTDKFKLSYYIMPRVVKMVQKYGKLGNDVNTREMIRLWFDT